MISFVKEASRRFPKFVYPIIHGSSFHFRPYVWPSYEPIKRSINVFSQFDIEQQHSIVLRRLLKTLKLASRVPFYRDFYAERGICLRDVRSFDDFSKLPVLSKSDLQSVSIRRRSLPHFSRYKVNTGGTSGAPSPSFFVTPNQISHE